MLSQALSNATSITDQAIHEIRTDFLPRVASAAERLLRHRSRRRLVLLAGLALLLIASAAVLLTLMNGEDKSNPRRYRVVVLGDRSAFPGLSCASAENGCLRVLASTIEVRSGPGTAYASLVTLEQGEEVSLTGRNTIEADAMWREVQTGAGQEGWIMDPIDGSVVEMIGQE